MSPSTLSLADLELHNPGHVYWNPTTAQLYEEIIRRGEGWLAESGPVVVRTGSHTGRSPRDKFIVREDASAAEVWWGKENRAFAPKRLEALYRRLTAYLQGRDVFIQECHAGADPAYRVPIRVVTELAWHSLFARNLFRQAHAPGPHELHRAAFTIIDAPRFRAIPELDGTNSEAFIILSFDRRLVIIGGTSYAGEIKKAVFTILNFLLPREEVLSMHCAASVGEAGDTALFFGLSGTGKTTLSTDPLRRLVGDDEHGWSRRGVFNFEGGCYAKTIHLSPAAEPEIFAATRRFGTVLENVGFDPERRAVDLDDASLTENTRAAYSITTVERAVQSGCADHPRHVFLLTCDAFGVLPPVAALDPAQACYHFLSGYTAKVAGTERGLGEPQATFSACFGAPFMALRPAVYGRLFAERLLRTEGLRCWLVNTGWTGGPYGVGSRISIAHTRALVHAALSGALDGAAYRVDPSFGLRVPVRCPGVPDALLDPEASWPDAAAYRAQARRLAALFEENFRAFEAEVPAEVRAAAPRVAAADVALGSRA